MNKIILLLSLLFAIVGCSPYKTMVDYNTSKNFSEYKTYHILNDKRSKGANSLYTKRVSNAIEQQMNIKGLTKSTTADLLVKMDFKVKQKKYVQTNTTAVGRRPGYYHKGRFHRYGYARGFATTTRSIESYPVGTLLLTFIDRENKEVIWLGVAKGAFSRKDMDDKMVNKLIEDVLKEFPPEK